MYKLFGMILEKGKQLGLFGGESAIAPQGTTGSSGLRWNVRGGMKPNHKYLRREERQGKYIYFYQDEEGNEYATDEEGTKVDVKEESGKKDVSKRRWVRQDKEQKKDIIKIIHYKNNRGIEKQLEYGGETGKEKEFLRWRGVQEPFEILSIETKEVKPPKQFTQDQLDKIDEADKEKKLEEEEYYKRFNYIRNEIGVANYGQVEGINIRISDHAGNIRNAELLGKEPTDLSFIIAKDKSKIGFRGDNEIPNEYDISNMSKQEAVEFINKKINEFKKPEPKPEPAETWKMKLWDFINSQLPEPFDKEKWLLNSSYQQKITELELKHQNAVVDAHNKGEIIPDDVKKDYPHISKVRNIWKPQEKEVLAEMKNPDEFAKWYSVPNAKHLHHDLIKKRLSEGKPVYEGYEKDYPDLAKKEEAEQPPLGTTQKIKLPSQDIIPEELKGKIKYQGDNPNGSKEFIVIEKDKPETGGNFTVSKDGDIVKKYNDLVERFKPKENPKESKIPTLEEFAKEQREKFNMSNDERLIGGKDYTSEQTAKTALNKLKEEGLYNNLRIDKVEKKGEKFPHNKVERYEIRGIKNWDKVIEKEYNREFGKKEEPEKQSITMPAKVKEKISSGDFKLTSGEEGVQESLSFKDNRSTVEKYEDMVSKLERDYEQGKATGKYEFSENGASAMLKLNEAREQLELKKKNKDVNKSFWLQIKNSFKTEFRKPRFLTARKVRINQREITRETT